MCVGRDAVVDVQWESFDDCDLDVLVLMFGDDFDEQVAVFDS